MWCSSMTPVSSLLLCVELCVISKVHFTVVRSVIMQMQITFDFFLPAIESSLQITYPEPESDAAESDFRENVEVLKQAEELLRGDGGNDVVVLVTGAVGGDGIAMLRKWLQEELEIRKIDKTRT